MAKTPQAEVESIRQRIATLRAERKALDAAFVPIDSAIARMHAHVDTLARAWSGRITAYYTQPGTNPQPPVLLIGNDEDQIAALVAWLQPDVVKQRLETEIRAVFENASTASMTPDELKAKSAAIEVELFDLEVKEEQLIVAAEATGLLINRRRDADARAILAA